MRDNPVWIKLSEQCNVVDWWTKKDLNMLPISSITLKKFLLLTLGNFLNMNSSQLQIVSTTKILTI